MNFADKNRAFWEKTRNLPEKKKRIILWTIVAIVAIVVCFLGVIDTERFVQKISKSMSQIKLPEVPGSSVPMPTIPTPTPPSASIGSADDLKTYTDTTLNISFKYPNDWKVSQTSKSDAAYDGDILIPNDSSGANDDIYISKIDCQSINQQHPGKIAACQEVNGVAVYCYGTVGNATPEIENYFYGIFTSVTKN